MSKTTSLFHIVFATKSRKSTLSIHNRELLHRFINSEIAKKGCKLYRINSMPDHVHMLIDLNPEIALTDFVRDIKSYSSSWLKTRPEFPHFDGWCRGYYAASKSSEHINIVINYIQNQEEHHFGRSLEDELKAFYKKYDFAWHDSELS